MQLFRHDRCVQWNYYEQACVLLVCFVAQHSVARLHSTQPRKLCLSLQASKATSGHDGIIDSVPLAQSHIVQGLLDLVTVPTSSVYEESFIKRNTRPQEYVTTQ